MAKLEYAADSKSVDRKIVPVRVRLLSPYDTNKTMNYFTKIDPIPRGPATRLDYGSRFRGGPPRCPVCKSSKNNRVHFNSDSSLYGWGFHCNICRVWWEDTNRVLCFVCEVEFIAPDSAEKYSCGPRVNEGRGTCYHINQIEHPFCPSCEKIAGKYKSMKRSQLRLLVGI